MELEFEALLVQLRAHHVAQQDALVAAQARMAQLERENQQLTARIVFFANRLDRLEAQHRVLAVGSGEPGPESDQHPDARNRATVAAVAATAQQPPANASASSAPASSVLVNTAPSVFACAVSSCAKVFPNRQALYNHSHIFHRDAKVRFSNRQNVEFIKRDPTGNLNCTNSQCSFSTISTVAMQKHAQNCALSPPLESNGQTNTLLAASVAPTQSNFTADPFNTAITSSAVAYVADDTVSSTTPAFYSDDTASAFSSSPISSVPPFSVISCPFTDCEKSFETENSARNHVADIHLDIVNVKYPGFSDAFEIKRNKEGCLNCPMSKCKYTARSRKVLKEHALECDLNPNNTGVLLSNTAATENSIINSRTVPETQPRPLPSPHAPQNATETSATTSTAVTPRNNSNRLIPPQTLPNGSANTEGYCPWTELVATFCPNVIHTAKHISNRVTSFRQKHAIPLVMMKPRVSPGRVAAACACIPEKLFDEFVAAISRKHSRVPDGSGGGGAALMANASKKRKVDFYADDGEKIKKERRGSAAAISDAIKYEDVVRNIVQGYDEISCEYKNAVKTAVGQFLENALEERFEEFVIADDPAPSATGINDENSGGGSDPNEGKTFLVPTELMQTFLDWAYPEFSRVFPDRVILPQKRTN